MSIATQISALQADKIDIADAITAKGGTVGVGDGFDDFASDIATIPQGGGSDRLLPFYEKGQKSAEFGTWTGMNTTVYEREEYLEMTGGNGATAYSSGTIDLTDYDLAFVESRRTGGTNPDYVGFSSTITSTSTSWAVRSDTNSGTVFGFRPLDVSALVGSYHFIMTTTVGATQHFEIAKIYLIKKKT